SLCAASMSAVGCRASVAVGDINGDGKLDLAVSTPESNNVSILLGNGAGGFSAATNFAVGAGPWSVAVGDFNGDGKLDLAVSNLASNNVSIFLSNGTGGLISARNFGVGGAPSSMPLSNINVDAKLALPSA